MPTKKRAKKQPESKPAPEPIAKVKKRRRRRKPVAQPVVVEKPKTLMQRIFEGQGQQLDQLNEELRAKVFGQT
jgi:hypothetical protein